MKNRFDFATFLEQTLFGLDIHLMLGDVEDFIDFSESNIDWQKRRELRKAEQECNFEVFDDPQFAAQYRDQTIEGIEYRFEVSLRQRVRYAALTALITTVEWIVISLKLRANFRIPKKADGKNEAVHLLEVFDNKTTLGLRSEIERIETLVQVRNCVVHAAGLLASYKYEPELRQLLSDFPGVSVGNINSLGDAIQIQQGHLQAMIEELEGWLPRLERTLLEKCLLRK